MRSTFYLMLVALTGLLAACEQSPKRITTEHGYQFIAYSNKGGIKPKPGEKVAVNVYTYFGDSLVGNTLRDLGGPSILTLYPKEKMPANVPAVYDATLLMGEGDSATVYQKLDSTMLARIPKAFQDLKEVRFDVVLVDVISAEEVEKKREQVRAQAAAVTSGVNNFILDLKSGKLNDKLLTTPSGLKVVMVEKNTGRTIRDGETISVQYYGCFMDGNKFDSSFDRGDPMTFIVGSSIPGFDEGIKMMSRESKAYFIIPSAIGYGEDGRPPVIPPNTDLVYYVEVLKF